MNEKGKDEAKKPGTGSGSDTVSAAKMGGNTPASGAGPGGTTGRPATPGTGSSTGASTATGAGSTQSSTLASQTSKPLGGGVGASTGAGAGLAAHSKDAQQPPKPGGMGGSPQGQPYSADQARAAASSTADQAKAAASSAADQAKPYVDQAKATASAAADTVKDTAADAAEALRQTAEAVQEKAGEAYEQASQWAREKYEQAADWASDEGEQRSRQFAYARRQGVDGYRQARGGVERFVSENPILVGIVGLAAGLLLGALLPRTRREDRAFGAWSDEVRDQGRRYAQDMAQRGREYVEEAFSDDDPRFAHHDSEYRGRGRRKDR